MYGTFDRERIGQLQIPDAVLYSESLSVQTQEHPIGTVALIGHCLATGDEITAACDTVGKTADERVLTELAGNYVTVVSNKERTSIYADLVGQFPVFFAQKEQRVYYGNDAQRIATHTTRMPDKLGLAVELGHVGGLVPTRSRYEGVQQLPAAHALHIDASGARIAAYDSLPPRDEYTFDAAADAVRNALLEAIHRRMLLGRTVSADFSGGLDSTSLAFLAASQISSQQKLQTYHSHFPKAIAGDLPYAKTYASLDSRIALQLVEIPSYRYQFEQGKPLYEPDKQLDIIKANHGDIHLNGSGGDALFTTAPAVVFDRASRLTPGQLPRFFGEVITVARLNNTDPLHVIRTIYKHRGDSYNAALATFVENLRVDLPSKNRWINTDYAAMPLLSRHMRQQLALAIETSPPHAAAHDKIGITDRSAIDELWTSGRFAAILRAEAQASGVDLHFPFHDHSVVRASLSLRAIERYHPHRFKPLLARALQGLVPSEVLERKSKGGYGPEMFADVRQNADNFREALGPNSLLARMGIIDVRGVERGIIQAEMGLSEAPLLAIRDAAKIERWLRTEYKAPSSKHIPASRVSQQRSSHSELHTAFVPDHVRAVQDEAGIALYNLRTKELRSLHHPAAAIFKEVSAASSIEAILQAVQSTLPEATDSRAFTASVIDTLLERGFLERGAAQAFTIAQAKPMSHALACETTAVGEFAKVRDVSIADLIAMNRALFKARSLVKRHDLYTVAQRLELLKQDLPNSTEARVQNKLRAGNALGRVYIGRVACLELSLATVLAEARQGRRVDWAIGMAPDPRTVHNWPEIGGQPIRSEFDDVIQGKYTKIGSW